MKNVINVSAYWLRPLGLVTVLAFVLLSFGVASALGPEPTPDNPQSGGVGLQGTIPSPPPSQAATIGTPSNGQSFTNVPITVAGICPNGLLIKLFINNVFSGSAVCTNGSYSISAPLFNGTNVLVVVDYDALNQAGPNSNAVTVNFNNSQAGAGPGITLTSDYARIGADPGSVLTWPLIISGGSPPYAINVDWGDNSSTLYSQSVGGTFNITHTYNSAGVYNVLIKVTDTAGNVSYLQVVAVANGKINQANNTNSSSSNTPKQGSKISPAVSAALIAGAILVPASTFWLGRRHMLNKIRKKLEIGERPF